MFDCRRIDVRLADREIFWVLYTNHPITQNEIARRLGVNPSTVYRAFQRFYRMGYLKQLTPGNRKAAEYEFHLDNLPESVRSSIIAKSER